MPKILDFLISSPPAAPPPRLLPSIFSYLYISQSSVLLPFRSVSITLSPNHLPVRIPSSLEQQALPAAAELFRRSDSLLLTLQLGTFRQRTAFSPYKLRQSHQYGTVDNCNSPNCFDGSTLRHPQRHSTPIRPRLPGLKNCFSTCLTKPLLSRVLLSCRIRASLGLSPCGGSRGGLRT